MAKTWPLARMIGFFTEFSGEKVTKFFCFFLFTKRRLFFFEKKKQKTFINLVS